MVGTLRRCVRSRRWANMAFVIAGISASVTPPAAVRASGASSDSSRAQPIESTPALVEVMPDDIGFKDVPVGETYSQAVGIKNVGRETLQIKEITAPSADFSIKGILLPVVVAPETSESFTISFRPRQEARSEGQIRIVTSPGDTPIVLKVRASTVTDQRELTASEAGIDFDDVAIGIASKKEVSFLNAGNHELSISAISISGAGFSLSGSGAATLSPGQRFTVDVNFAPKNTGRQTGSLRALSADGGSLLEMPLAGSGAESSQSVVKLNWEENAASTGGYVVYRAPDPSGPFMRISTQAVPSAEYVDTGLAAGHTYYYVVTSVGTDDVESEYSPPISATVPGA
jgi:hypothetical protein